MPLTVALTAASINAALGYTAANASNVLTNDVNSTLPVGTITQVNIVAATSINNLSTYASNGAGNMTVTGNAIPNGQIWRNISGVTNNGSSTLGLFQRIS